MSPVSTTPTSLRLRRGERVHVDWKDDTSAAGTIDDGSYSGTAKFVRHVRPGTNGCEMLEFGPHCVVKVSPDDLGSFFALSAILPILPRSHHNAPSVMRGGPSLADGDDHLPFGAM